MPGPRFCVAAELSGRLRALPHSPQDWAQGSLPFIIGLARPCLFLFVELKGKKVFASCPSIPGPFTSLPLSAWHLEAWGVLSLEFVRLPRCPLRPSLTAPRSPAGWFWKLREAGSCCFPSSPFVPAVRVPCRGPLDAQHPSGVPLRRRKSRLRGRVAEAGLCPGFPALEPLF